MIALKHIYKSFNQHLVLRDVSLEIDQGEVFGIIGGSGAGKSTLFKTLTKKQVPCENFPFCTIEPNIGLVDVPDERLQKLADRADLDGMILAAAGMHRLQFTIAPDGRLKKLEVFADDVEHVVVDHHPEPEDPVGRRRESGGQRRQGGGGGEVLSVCKSWSGYWRRDVMTYPRNAASPPVIAIGAIYLLADGTIQTTGASARVKTGSGAWATAAGTLACDSTSGVWTYTLDNANHQNLAAGETQTDVFTVTVSDGKGGTDTQDVTITIHGTNDAPVITSDAQTGSVTEDTQLTASGVVTSSEVDNGATATYTVANGTGDYGTLALDSTTGAWTYTLDDAAANTLAGGQVVNEVFVVYVSDGRGGVHSREVTISINGTNDAAIITGTSSARLFAAMSSRVIGLVAVPRTSRVWCRSLRPSRVTISAIACVVFAFDSAALPTMAIRSRSFNTFGSRTRLALCEDSKVISPSSSISAGFMPRVVAISSARLRP